MKNLILLLILITIGLSAQSTPPKREFRAAWIATVTNLDWPSSSGAHTDQKKIQLINLLDALKGMNINVVIFQIRTECDALYASNYEPWSHYLTGMQGTPPNPYFDPLEFAIDEAHKRGMELHAWFNPYRAVREVGSYSIHSSHVSLQHPDWILTFSNFKMLNPGIPLVRDYVSNVIMDVVRRYDVDGIHMDDYFYPYPPNQITNQDQQTFQQYPNGFTNIADWRRDNVNRLIKQINDSVQAVKPYVKFGMSPFGIWKNGVPPGITGLDAYSTIYCDAIAWLQQRTIDYLTPQLYWQIGGSQDFIKLMNWWADSTFSNQRHLYPGHAPYRINSSNWSASELPNQIRLTRGNSKVGGSVFFRAGSLIDNPKGFADTLRNDLYRYPAFPPIMNWKDVINPNPIRNLRFERLDNLPIAGIKWDEPLPASDGNTAYRYAVYRFNSPPMPPVPLESPEFLYDVVSTKYYSPKQISGQTNNYFVITALDRNFNESSPSIYIQINAPSIPALAIPSNGTNNLPPEFNLVWNYGNGAASYRLQISTNSDFSSILREVSGLTDTTYLVTGLEGENTYYWRVRSENISGNSNYSTAFSFSTGYPLSPQLLSPPDATGNISIDTILIWAKRNSADSYKFQLSKNINFDASGLVVDATGLTDTTYHVTALEYNRFYFWRVKAVNSVGESQWSTTFRFKTLNPTSVNINNDILSDFSLMQNYPNPFNPETIISFSLPQPADVEIKIYNVLGKEIKTLAKGSFSSGVHSVIWNAKDENGIKVSSGVYLYVMKTGNKIFTRKMILMD